MKETKTLSIDGMTCGNCVRHVSQALSGLEGVDVKEVGIGVAKVAYDPAEIQEGKVLQAVKEAGYEARVNE